MPVDGSLNFKDLVIRVAQPGMNSVGTTGPGVPENTSDLGLCRQWVNDGREELYRRLSAATLGAFLHRPVSFSIDPSTPNAASIDGDAHRVRLPWWCSGPVASARWWWSDGAGTRGAAAFVHIDRVDMMLAQISGGGPPQLVAVVPMEPGDDVVSVRRGWELRISPLPDRSYTLSGMVLASCQPMSDDDERDPAGPEHDQAIIACALAKRFMHNPDAGLAARYEALADKAIAASIAIEVAKLPLRGGQIRDPETDADDPQRRLGRPYEANRVSELDGVSMMS